MLSIARIIACRSLIEWAKSRDDPHRLIAGNLKNEIKPEDTAFSRELFFGSIKFKKKIDYYINHFTNLKNADLKLRQVLRLGFYQLIQAQNIPQYAVVSETAELARKFCSEKQVGFVNAVMRNYQRQPEKVEYPDPDDNSVKYLGVEYSYPDWLVSRYLERFGYDDTIKILKWGNDPPDFFFFINKYLYSENDIENELNNSGISFSKLNLFKGYYKCLDPSKLIKSGVFRNGKVIVGDPAQSLATVALAPSEGKLVLDIFASPGGKTASLAGMIGSNGKIFAADISLKRLKIMRQNITRWRLDNIFIICSDALKFASGRKFEYILADVPCSGTGTLRRNPDLRWNLKEKDIQRLSEKQARLLKEAANMLSSKGLLVYSTCSLEPEENSQIVEKFLKQNGGFRLKKVIELENFNNGKNMYEILPYHNFTDGAFVAAIERD